MKRTLLSTVLCLSIISSGFALDHVLKVRISSQSNAYSDETVVRFINGASAGFDGSYDAYKLFGNNNTVSPSIFTRSSEGYNLSINAHPNLDSTVSFDMYSWSPVAGTFQLEFDFMGDFPSGTFVLLEDLELDTVYTVTDELTLTIHLPVNQSNQARFQLHFARRVKFGAVKSCAAIDDGKLVLEYPSSEQFSSLILNEYDSVLIQEGATSQNDTISELPTGTYRIIPAWRGISGDTTEYVIGSHPEISSTVDIVRCTSPHRSDGSIDVAFSVNSNDLTFLWSDGNTTEDRDGLSPGVYALTATYLQQCVVTDTFEVLAKLSPSIASAPQVFEGHLASSEITDTTLSSDSLADDDVLSNKIFASQTSVKIYPNPSNGAVNLDITGSMGTCTINVFNLSGHCVHSELKIGYGRIAMDLTDLPNGVYIVSAREGSKRIDTKLIIAH